MVGGSAFESVGVSDTGNRFQYCSMLFALPHILLTCAELIISEGSEHQASGNRYWSGS